MSRTQAAAVQCYVGGSDDRKTYFCISFILVCSTETCSTKFWLVCASWQLQGSVLCEIEGKHFRSHILSTSEPFMTKRGHHGSRYVNL